MRRSLALAFLALVTGSTVRCVDFAGGCEGTRTCPAESSGGGTTGSTSAPTTSTGSFSEDCLNGFDDDGDSHIDCDDSDCQPNFECVGPVPPNWQNYVYVHKSVYPSEITHNCADNTTPTIYYRNPNTDDYCAACSCTPEGATCSDPEISCDFVTNNCNELKSDLGPINNDTQCFKKPSISTGTTISSCQITQFPRVANRGECILTAEHQPFEGMWKNEIHVCPIINTGRECTNGQTCIPRSIDGYESGICIMRDGPGDCPHGWSTKTEVYSGGDDNRDCNTCVCNNDVKCQGGSFIAYNLDNCFPDPTATEIIINTSMCTDVSDNLDFGSGSLKRIPAAVIVTGLCSADSSTSTVAPSGLHTICCR
jgi:hypothetical protein